MTPAEVAAILRQFNEWRRSDYEPSEQPAPPDPREISEAIDAAVEMMDEIERLRAELATEQRLSFRDQIAGLETEVERLRAQNEVLIDAINAASALMASAPAWHAMHRETIEQLQQVRKEVEQ